MPIWDDLGLDVEASFCADRSVEENQDLVKWPFSMFGGDGELGDDAAEADEAPLTKRAKVDVEAARAEAARADAEAARADAEAARADAEAARADAEAARVEAARANAARADAQERPAQRSRRGRGRGGGRGGRGRLTATCLHDPRLLPRPRAEQQRGLSEEAKRERDRVLNNEAAACSRARKRVELFLLRQQNALLLHLLHAQ